MRGRRYLQVRGTFDISEDEMFDDAEGGGGVQMCVSGAGGNDCSSTPQVYFAACAATRRILYRVTLQTQHSVCTRADAECGGHWLR